MTPRAYQRDQNARVYAAFSAGHRRVISQMPTGAGKTATSVDLIRHELSQGHRIIFAAHRDSLVTDTARRLGLDCGIIAAGHRATPAPVQVCSLGTLHARGLTPPADLVILDEAHISMASTHRSWLQRYPEARILGLTATPERGDGQPLGDEWDALVQGPSIRALTDAGYLVRSHMVVPRGQGRGDAAAEIRRLGVPGSHRVLVFSESIDEAKALSCRLRTAGYRVAEVYGSTSHARRELTREQLRAGELDVLVGVGVFVEGWDEPSVDVVVLDAAFGHVGKYLQAIGRGVRPHPGKSLCTVLDVRGAVWLHGPPDLDREWTLTGEFASRPRAPGLQLGRCDECWAVFERAAECPRCGAKRVTKVKMKARPVTRAERMQAYDAMDPAEVRHIMYSKAYTKIRRMGLGKGWSPQRAETFAVAKAQAVVAAWDKRQAERQR